MTNPQNTDPGSTETAIAKSLETIFNAAQAAEGEPMTLLAILRKLESLHKQVRDTLFQESLPDNRQALYVLLRDIETSGGWPYIYRPKLQELMERLTTQELEQLIADESTVSSSPTND